MHWHVWHYIHIPHPCLLACDLLLGNIGEMHAFLHFKHLWPGVKHVCMCMYETYLVVVRTLPPPCLSLCLPHACCYSLLFPFEPDLNSAFPAVLPATHTFLHACAMPGKTAKIKKSIGIFLFSSLSPLLSLLFSFFFSPLHSMAAVLTWFPKTCHLLLSSIKHARTPTSLLLAPCHCAMAWLLGTGGIWEDRTVIEELTVTWQAVEWSGLELALGRTWRRRHENTTLLFVVMHAPFSRLDWCNCCC